jgi:hypothetical protein
MKTAKAQVVKLNPRRRKARVDGEAGNRGRKNHPNRDCYSTKSLFPKSIWTSESKKGRKKQNGGATMKRCINGFPHRVLFTNALLFTSSLELSVHFILKHPVANVLFS